MQSRKALELQMQRVQEELRGYADRGGQKRPSYREQYNKRIQELEQQSACNSHPMTDDL